jgi:putative transposase
MDGKGRRLDNVFIERLWRSLKYECVYLKEFETGLVARQEIRDWIRQYNWERPYSSLPDDKTPMEVYNERMAA